MAPRLKVFLTSDGLTDYVVAASSRPKALAAWGSRQDLFRTGLARETDAPELVKAATARPGEVLRRPAGTRGELAMLKAARRAEPKSPTRAALKKVADLEKRLAAAEAAFDRAGRVLQDKRAKLDEEIAQLERRRAADLARLQDDLRAARRALG